MARRASVEGPPDERLEALRLSFQLSFEFASPGAAVGLYRALEAQGLTTPDELARVARLVIWEGFDRGAPERRRRALSSLPEGAKGRFAERLVGQAAVAFDPELRREACTKLASWPSSRALPVLEALLEDSSPAVRHGAVVACAAVLLDAEDEAGRARVARALVARAGLEPDAALRQACFEALSGQPERRALRAAWRRSSCPLERALASAASEGVLEAFGGFGGGAASDESRRALLVLLGALDRRAGGAPQTHALISAALAAPEVEARRAGVAAAARVRDPRLAESLLGIAVAAGRPALRGAAVVALARCDPAAFKASHELFRGSPRAALRAAALEAFESIEAQSLEALLEGALGLDRALAVAAVDLLAARGASASGALLAALRRGGLAARVAAARALGRHQSRGAALALMSSYRRDRAPEVRRAALEALGFVVDWKPVEARCFALDLLDRREQGADLCAAAIILRSEARRGSPERSSLGP